MAAARISSEELPWLDRGRFVELFGGVFEHAPWVAEQAFAAGPFRNIETLHGAMVEAMRRAPRERQLALIRAHPDLAGRSAIAGDLTAASSAEQASAGLDQCTPAELERFREFNQTYQTRFGFPFILAVKGRSRAEVLAIFEQRVRNPLETEFQEALHQIEDITRLRLAGLIQP